MTPLTIPLHLLIPTALSLSGLVFLLLKRKTLRRKNYALYKSFIIFLSAYALIVGNALGHDLYYQWDLNRYDLNQDSFFSKAEATSEQVLAMERLINDSDRNFSIISGFIVSAILSISVFIVIKAGNALFGSVEDNDSTNILNKVQTD